jgi:uncharacterized protein with von Willebrand factor type A (vWA) domain
MIQTRTVHLDLPPLVGAFARRLHEAGVPVTADRSARFAQALVLVEPISRRRLYWTARAALVTDPAQLNAFDAVFFSVFGARDQEPAERDAHDLQRIPAPPDRRSMQERSQTPPGAGAPQPGAEPSSAAQRDEHRGDASDVPVPVAASDEEVLRAKRFDALDPAELAALYRLMTRLRLATPTRRARRAERDRHGERIDLRRTLRQSLRTGGDPIRLARRRRRIVRRRMVMLCDISGSMEPYARAYLQFLTCATGAGAHAEAFVFATRLTRLTRALRSRNPERAIQRAAAAAPDWSSGTRIGDALREFNDRYGRRGMARGAVVVILSDGWERGDPALVGREMRRLARLAYRIVWVNPRVSARGFAPRAGGMAAALSSCDALVSGHTLDALDEVVEAIGARDRDVVGAGWTSIAAPELDDDDEPWGSATPVPGSSVAMPSGYGPSRGHTTPGWNRS